MLPRDRAVHLAAVSEEASKQTGGLCIVPVEASRWTSGLRVLVHRKRILKTTRYISSSDEIPCDIRPYVHPSPNKPTQATCNLDHLRRRLPTDTALEANPSRLRVYAGSSVRQTQVQVRDGRSILIVTACTSSNGLSDETADGGAYLSKKIAAVVEDDVLAPTCLRGLEADFRKCELDCRGKWSVSHTTIPAL